MCVGRYLPEIGSQDEEGSVLESKEESRMQGRCAQTRVFVPDRMGQYTNINQHE